MSSLQCHVQLLADNFICLGDCQCRREAAVEIVIFDDLLPKSKSNVFALRLQPHEFSHHSLVDELAIFVFVATHLRSREAAKLQFDCPRSLVIPGPQAHWHNLFILQLPPRTHNLLAAIFFDFHSAMGC